MVVRESRLTKGKEWKGNRRGEKEVAKYCKENKTAEGRDGGEGVPYKRALEQ